HLLADRAATSSDRELSCHPRQSHIHRQTQCHHPQFNRQWLKSVYSHDGRRRSLPLGCRLLSLQCYRSVGSTTIEGCRRTCNIVLALVLFAPPATVDSHPAYPFCSGLCRYGIGLILGT